MLCTKEEILISTSIFSQMTCARSKHHPVSCGPDELCLSGLWWDLFWYAHGEGRAIIYPVVVISDIAGRLDHSCMHIHHAPLSVLCFEGFSGTCCETETLGCIPVNVGLEETLLSQSSPRSTGICAMRAQGALVAALSTRESNTHLCTAASVLP